MSQCPPVHNPKRRRLTKARDLEGDTKTLSHDSAMPSSGPERASTSVPASVPAASQRPGGDAQALLTEAAAGPSAVDDMEDHAYDAEDAPDEQNAAAEVERYNDTQCAECDDGGIAMQCDGGCQRSFHFYVPAPAGRRDEDALEHEVTVPDVAICNPLAMPSELSNACHGDARPWQCPNCFTGVHQCFSCKKEGRSRAWESGGQEVYRCSLPACTYYYHANCAHMTKEQKEGLFVCPLHNCAQCKKGPDWSISHGRGLLIPCRRCPTAYHQQCLPPKLRSADPQRVWIPAREENGELKGGDDQQVEVEVMYCHRHTIDPDKDQPGHRKPIIHPDLLKQWHYHLASSYPWLQWSKDFLRDRRRQQQQEEEQEEDPSATAKVSLKSPPDAAKAPASTTATASQKAVKRKAAEAGVSTLQPPVKRQPTMKLGEADKKAYSSTAAAKKRAADVVAAGRAHESMEVVLRNARKPEPYATPSTNTVTQAQLDSWRKALDGATNALARGNKPEAQRQWLPHHIVTSMLQREDQMRISLAPFLHASRYTSYGRHFTLTPMLKLLSEQLVPFMDHEDTVVDFSCGANEWVPLMKRECAKHGKQCRGRSFDIITPMDVQDYVQKSWFDVRDRGHQPRTPEGPLEMVANLGSRAIRPP
ncbi:hypothetical protein WJX73_003070 [Symbiochloris irregularis]|uniref:Zinc finger PHD-type domain-containing protein n=1 Tax=Symbiochloris irregularis TaxID=706552 RepID=A0AAW1NST3_9CHLO